jgi:hypothetical protein
MHPAEVLPIQYFSQSTGRYLMLRKVPDMVRQYLPIVLQRMRRLPWAISIIR